MTELIQQFVDDLAARLGRSVEVDDCTWLPIAISPQYGSLDEIRINAVLQRRSPVEVREYGESLGIRTATEPVRCPPSDRLRGVALPRLCIPVRDTTQAHWGYLWLIDANPPLSDSDIDDAVETAAAIAEEMHIDSPTTAPELVTERNIVKDLLSSDEHQRIAAANRIEGRASLSEGPFTTFIAELDGCDDLIAVMPNLTSSRSAGHLLLGWDAQRVIFIGAVNVLERRVGSIRHALESTASRQGFTVVGSGLGSAVNTLDELPMSHRHARYAVRVSAADATKAGFARWSQLGADTVFEALPWSAETLDLLHPGASRLLQPAHSLIASTLLIYFDSGSDTRQCIEQLAIHRTTLYYRLDRACLILGRRWDPSTQLGLHLALRLGLLMTGERLRPCSTRPTDRR